MENRMKKKKEERTGWGDTMKGSVYDWNEKKNSNSRSVLHDYIALFFSFPDQSDSAGYNTILSPRFVQQSLFHVWLEYLR